MILRRNKISAAAACIGLSVSPAVAEDMNGIALSLVHGSEALNIPLHAIDSLEVTSIEVASISYSRPVLQVCLSPSMHSKLCSFTAAVVGKAVDIVVACNLVSAPIVYEPLCSSGCLNISAEDKAHAEDLAEQIRKGIAHPCRGAS